MTHDAPREMVDASGNKLGKWRYTRRNDDQTYAIGLCAQDCPGHDTPNEACEHYKQYLLNGLRIRGPKADKWPKFKCRKHGCDNEGTHYLMIPDRLSDLLVCEQHANADTAAELISVGESWGC